MLSGFHSSIPRLPVVILLFVLLVWQYACYTLVFLFHGIFRARGIKYRQEKNEAVAGFFNQIGELYTAYHLWGE